MDYYEFDLSGILGETYQFELTTESPMASVQRLAPANYFFDAS